MPCSLPSSLFISISPKSLLERSGSYNLMSDAFKSKSTWATVMQELLSSLRFCGVKPWADITRRISYEIASVSSQCPSSQHHSKWGSIQWAEWGLPSLPFPRLLSASPLPGSYPLPGQFSTYTYLYHAEHSTEHVLLLELFLGVPLSSPSGWSAISLNKHGTLHFFLPYFPIGDAIIPISTERNYTCF